MWVLYGAWGVEIVSGVRLSPGSEPRSRGEDGYLRLRGGISGFAWGLQSLMVRFMIFTSFKGGDSLADGILAGSDVANIQTTARLEGDHYVVNGAKKWITNGIWADYCTAAVRTGGPGRNGISLLVIPLTAPGVTRRRMHNSGVNASGMTCLQKKFP